MENLIIQLVDTARMLRREFDRRAAGIGVTRPQWMLLVRLFHCDGQRQVDLAEQLEVEPITLCRMIDRMEEAGLVERRRDERDRRAWRIHLTPRSTPIIADLREVGERLHERALDGLDEAQRLAAASFLAQIKDNLNSVTTERRAS